MRWLFGVTVAVALAVGTASASAAPVPGRVILGFGERYSEGSATRTHRGMDVAMDAGSPVSAPLGGRVRFAGRIPADGGGTVGAVTLETAQGAVTLLPLSSLALSAGERVGEGDCVGTLSETGDGSSASSHLHVGLRQADVYLDPAVVFSAAVAPAPSPEPAPQPVTAPEPGARPVDSPAPVAIAGPAVVIGDVPCAAPSEAADRLGQNAPAERVGHEVGRQRAGIAVSARSMPQGVSLASDAGAVRGGATSALAARAGGTMREMLRAPERPTLAARALRPAVDTSSRVLRAALPGEHTSPAALLAGGAVCAVALIAAAFLLGVRRMGRFGVDRLMLSDRFGMLLQHMRTGGTLPRLNSCSGLSAFTDPGPPAQRR
jgi:hypothetical protein